MASENLKIIPIPLGMVNSYLLKCSDGQSALVDCGVPGADTVILKKMGESGVKPSSVKLIFITHGHSDHVGSISAIRKATGAKTVIHKNDAGIIRTGKNPPLHPIKPIAKLLTHISGDTVKSFTPYEPEIIIENEMSLAEFGIDGKIIETPGHTKGSISLLLNSGSIFAGDAMMGGIIRKGKAGFPMFAEDIEKMHDSIQKIISLSPQAVYIGHGGPFSLEEIRNINKLS